jgi:hypothetical protein
MVGRRSDDLAFHVLDLMAGDGSVEATLKPFLAIISFQCKLFYLTISKKLYIFQQIRNGGTQ